MQLSALSSRWQGMNPAHLAGWVTLALVLLLAYALARLTWTLLVPAATVLPQTTLDPFSGVDVRESSSAPVADDLARVAGLHLFGQAEAGPGGSAPVPEDTPDTRLSLSLKGVVADTAQRRSMALIADEQGNEQHYILGAELPGGATLEQIHADRVVLRRAGRFEQMRLPRDAPPTAAAVSAPEPVASAAIGGSIPSSVRQQWLEDPSALFDMVQAQPVMQDGALRGFAISPRREARMFRQAGLRPGDVVTGINGVTLAGIDDPAALMGQLAGAQQLVLDIERNGRPNTVVVEVGQ